MNTAKKSNRHSNKSKEKFNKMNVKVILSCEGTTYKRKAKGLQKVLYLTHYYSIYAHRTDSLFQRHLCNVITRHFTYPEFVLLYKN